MRAHGVRVAAALALLAAVRSLPALPGYGDGALEPLQAAPELPPLNQPAPEPLALDDQPAAEAPPLEQPAADAPVVDVSPQDPEQPADDPLQPAPDAPALEPPPPAPDDEPAPAPEDAPPGDAPALNATEVAGVENATAALERESSTKDAFGGSTSWMSRTKAVHPRATKMLDHVQATITGLDSKEASRDDRLDFCEAFGEAVIDYTCIAQVMDQYRLAPIRSEQAQSKGPGPSTDDSPPSEDDSNGELAKHAETTARRQTNNARQTTVTASTNVNSRGTGSQNSGAELDLSKIIHPFFIGVTSNEIAGGVTTVDGKQEYYPGLIDRLDDARCMKPAKEALSPVEKGALTAVLLYATMR
jgi:hypothetical protein